MNSSVIIIDDNQDLTEVFSLFFSLKSINVLAVGRNGKDAIKLYEKYKPNVVVMDFQMPDFDGLYGVENIKKINPNAKIILLTGSTGKRLFKKFTELGISAIIQKPCDMDNLVELINKISKSDAIRLNSLS
ncbi:CheY-like receiver [metagenome]